MLIKIKPNNYEKSINKKNSVLAMNSKKIYFTNCFLIIKICRNSEEVLLVKNYIPFNYNEL